MLTLDVDDVLERFQVRAGRRLAPAAVNKRRTALTEALELFRTFIGEPGEQAAATPSPSPIVEPYRSDLQPGPPPGTPEPGPVTAPPGPDDEPDLAGRAHRVPPRVSATTRVARRRSSFTKAVPSMPIQRQSATTRRLESSERLTYPFPLRPGLVVRISLPPDLTGRESRRLARFLETLTVDSEHLPTRAANGHASSSPRPSSQPQATS